MRPFLLACWWEGGWSERAAVRPAPCYFTRQSDEPGLTIGTYARCCCCCSLAISVECYEVCVYICSLNTVRAVGFGAIAVLLIGVKRSTQTDTHTHTHGGKKGKHGTPRDVGAALRKQSTNTREINNVLVCAHTHIWHRGDLATPFLRAKMVERPTHQDRCDRKDSFSQCAFNCADIMQLVRQWIRSTKTAT